MPAKLYTNLRINYSFKGTVLRDVFGFWCHVGLVLGLNRGRRHFQKNLGALMTLYCNINDGAPKKFKNWQHPLFRLRTNQSNHTWHQKPNPSRETVPLIWICDLRVEITAFFLSSRPRKESKCPVLWLVVSSAFPQIRPIGMNYGENKTNRPRQRSSLNISMGPIWWGGDIYNLSLDILTSQLFVYLCKLYVK